MVRLSNNGSNSSGRKRVARRRDARRMEILGAAASSFRNRGFAATGMREIAAAADLSPANVYHYFRGKQELLYFCQDTSLDRLLAALEAANHSRRPVSERLRLVIASHVRCVLGEMVGATAHLEIDDLPPRMRRRILAKRDRYERGIRQIVAAGIRSGAFAPSDPKLVTQAILGALNWTARWYRPEGALRPEEVGDAFATYLVRGLVATSRRARPSGRSRSNGHTRLNGRARMNERARRKAPARQNGRRA